MRLSSSWGPMRRKWGGGVLNHEGEVDKVTKFCEGLCSCKECMYVCVSGLSVCMCINTKCMCAVCVHTMCC